MKKNLMFTALITLLISVSSFCEVSFSFKGMGAGGQISLTVPEDRGVAFGFGFRGMAEFSLDRFGSIQYHPSFTFWFKGDDRTVPSATFYHEYEERFGQVSLNLFDIKYLFPVPNKIFIKPYTGISILPCIVINTYSNEWKQIENTTHRVLSSGEDDTDSDADLGFNLFFGIDFPVSNRIVPFVEWRFTASHKWALRLSGGLMFCF